MHSCIPSRSFLLISTFLGIVGPYHTAFGEGYHFYQGLLDKADVSAADVSIFAEGSTILPGKYIVRAFLNTEYQDSIEVTFQVFNKEVKPCFSEEQVIKLGINIRKYLNEDIQNKCFNIEQIIPQSRVEYDNPSGKLDIIVPQADLIARPGGYIPHEYWDNGITAAFINYDFTYNKPFLGQEQQPTDRFYLNLNTGLNIGFWRIRNNSTWDKSSERSRFTSSETSATRIIVPWESELVVGETFTDGALFESFPFRGMSIYSDESQIPDTETGFAPVVRGVANSNAIVELWQNKYLISSRKVPPGPFEFNDLNPTSNSGDIEVRVIEENGLVNSFMTPFSSVPNMQREGRISYNLSGGIFRNSFDGVFSTFNQWHSPLFLQGAISRGFKNSLTPYSGFQISKEYQSALLGVGLNVGRLGAVSLQTIQSHSMLQNKYNKLGQSIRFLYAKTLSSSGTSFQLIGYRYNTKNYYNFSDIMYLNHPGQRSYYWDYKNIFNVSPMAYYKQKKMRLRFSMTQNLFGVASFYVTSARESYWKNQKPDFLLQIGASTSWNFISLNANYTYNRNTFDRRLRQSATFNISMPLGVIGDLTNSNEKYANFFNRNSISYSSYLDDNKAISHILSLSGITNGGKLNYSVSQNYQQASLKKNIGGSVFAGYRLPVGNASAGFSYSSTSKTVNASLRGGIVAHRGGVTLSQPIYDSFNIVDTRGVSGIKISNRSGIATDWFGYAIVPNLRNYHINRVILDTTSFGDLVDIQDNVAAIIPTKGAITVTKFDANKGKQAVFTVKKNGENLPFGTKAILNENRTIGGIVSDGGFLFMSGLPGHGEIELTWGTKPDQRCSIPYTLPIKKDRKSLIRSKIELECPG